jgi:hypothetical protein
MEPLGIDGAIPMPKLHVIALLDTHTLEKQVQPVYKGENAQRSS